MIEIFRGKLLVAFIVLLVIVAICVILIGTTSLGSDIIDVIDPANRVNISEFNQQADGSRITVEGYFQDLDRWIIISGEYDCDNYLLSTNIDEPYGEIINLCVNIDDINNDEINIYIGDKVLLTGRVEKSNGLIKKYLYINTKYDIQLSN